jgi:hypothetical protein
MALSVAMTGSGNVGEILPSWSVQESATPVSIGDSAASTGVVSFAARSTDESLLVINNNVVSSADGLGSVSGVVQSVSQTGATVSVTHNTVLEKYNMDVRVPPVSTGGVRGWFYQLGLALGLQQRTNFLPSPNNGGISFPFDASVRDFTDAYSIDSVFKNSDRAVIAGEVQGFSYSSPGAPAWDLLTYNTWSLPFTTVDDSNDTWLQFVATIDSSSQIFLGQSYGDAVGAPTYYNLFTFDIDGSTDVVTIWEGGSETQQTLNIASLDNSQPILFTFRLHGTVVNEFNYAELTMYATDHTGTVVSNTTPVTVSSYGINWEMQYDHINTPFMGCVNVFQTAVGATAPTAYIDTTLDGNYATIDFTDYSGTYVGAYPATEGVAWELMQKLGAAELFEVSASGDNTVVRDIGLTTFVVDNISTPATIAPSTTFSGSKLNIEYSNPSYFEGTLYDALDDSNNVLTVGVAETTIASVKGAVNPLTLVQPVATPDWVFPVPDGKYYVVDSSDLECSAAFLDHGGKINVAVDPEDYTAIQVTVVGPRTEPPGYPGPYRIAASTGSDDFAALSILGSGVTDGENVAVVGTGADPEKFLRSEVTTVNNPFIRTIGHAYDRGMWAAVKAGCPVVTINLAVPTSAVAGFGLTAGALFEYANSTYRITSVTVGAAATSLVGERHVTVADMDAIWGSQTVADYDGVWGTRECQDQIIYPYLGA